MKIRKSIALAFLLLIACGKKDNQGQDLSHPPASAEQNDLPAVIGEKGDGSSVDFKAIKGETVIVLFQTDCDHCQREATEIKKHIAEFKNYAIYFITAGPWSEVEDFARQYGLSDEPKVTFVVTSVDSITKNFGYVSTPSVYVFDANGRQKATFNGETDIMKIVNSL